ncbi:hypothetical protein [Cognaticolwellia beringensis]|uniref:Uncharacterized protein n=1 Tax=Cognaticolwellia beringensis TaxID=1967665 RepID=A0A222G4A4_9GAMM|nr:hypothetical protein [Cognaticolwellia beringensis]ASP46433.1 hypothetical protein B5D82_00780 [Cognaticolwellia beringensis]
MFRAISRVLLIALIFVAFVGQAITFNTSMSCETSVDSLSPNFSELVKHYDLSTINTDNSEDCCGIECCDVGCTCIANACSSFAYFNIEIVSTKATALSETLFIQQSEQPKSISTLLYRPPIFIS